MAEFHNGELNFPVYSFSCRRKRDPTDSKACLKYYVGQPEGYIHVFVNEILCLYAHGNPNRLG